MAELLGLPYSPWSEKARWALDARRVPYTFRLYAPLVGEPGLRLKIHKWTGPVTVPVFTADDGRVLTDSAEIARWADEHGEGPALFPADLQGEVAALVAASERGLAAGRRLALARMLKDRQALREMVPRALRRPLGPVAATLGGLGVRRTLRKYAVAGAAPDADAELDAVLGDLRRALGGGKTILGTFTFGDIAMAQVLAFVVPPSFGLRIAQNSRKAFTDVARVGRYADLLAWRDALYDAQRPRV